MMLSAVSPRAATVVISLAAGFAVIGLCLLRARYSRYPALLYTCAGYMVLLHAIWIAGLLSGRLFSSGFATLQLLTFPWSMAVIFDMTMAGFSTLRDLLVNYLRFVLGFGGIQCLLLTLFVWELGLTPRRRNAPRAQRSMRG